jgi:hypothetical protein
MSRKGYEFSDGTINAEKRAFRRRNPDKRDEKPEVHHILPIHKAKEYGVPKEAVKSHYNAVALTKEDHLKAHRTIDDETYQTLAQALSGMFRKIL